VYRNTDCSPTDINRMKMSWLSRGAYSRNAVRLWFIRYDGSEQWYLTLFVHVSPDVISLQLCTPKLVGV
jgi:hypothetical protein